MPDLTHLLQPFAVAALYALALLICWIFVPLVALFAAQQLLRAFPMVNRRKLGVALAPALSATETVLDWGHRVIWLIAGLLLSARGGGAVGLIASGSPERRLGEMVFVPAFVWFVLVVLPRAFALPKGAPGMDREWLAHLVFRSAILAALYTYIVTHPGHVYVAGIGGILLAAWETRVRVNLLARSNFSRSPVAIPEAAAPGIDESPLFLHLSDIHITHPPGRSPSGGGRAGTAELQAIAAEVGQGGRSPRYLIVTGDLVDSGKPEEWRAGRAVLDRLREFTRVILAPGNHDLVPSYDMSDAIWAMRHSGSAMDGIRLLIYLEHASALEPELCVCDGQPIVSVIAAERRRIEELKAQWLSATKAVRSFSPIDVQGILALRQAFGQSAHRLYPEWPAESMERLVRVDLQDLDVSVSEPLWAARWYDCFPLRMTAGADGIEFFITNPTAPEARLAGSALGRCGAGQLDRLDAALAQSQAPMIVVLHHNAPFRWREDTLAANGTLLRWGMLAHDPAESRRLGALLLRTARQGKQVFMLSGHRHDASMCGRIAPGADSPAAAGDCDAWFLECGALGEASASLIPAGFRAHGRTSPRLVPRLQGCRTPPGGGASSGRGTGSEPVSLGAY